MSQVIPEIVAGLGCLCVVLTVALLPVILLQGLGCDVCSLIDLRRIRRSLCSMKQFRLRTLLLGFSFIQVGVAVVTWRRGHGDQLSSILWCLAFGSFIAWVIWTCLADARHGAGSRRWKHITRPDRIVEPIDEEQ